MAKASEHLLKSLLFCPLGAIGELSSLTHSISQDSPGTLQTCCCTKHLTGGQACFSSLSSPPQEWYNKFIFLFLFFSLYANIQSSRDTLRSRQNLTQTNFMNLHGARVLLMKQETDVSFPVSQTWVKWVRTMKISALP